MLLELSPHKFSHDESLPVGRFKTPSQGMQLWFPKSPLSGAFGFFLLVLPCEGFHLFVFSFMDYCFKKGAGQAKGVLGGLQALPFTPFSLPC